MPRMDLARFYKNILEALAGGQLIYDEDEGYFRLMGTNPCDDDADYVLVTQFLDNDRYVHRVTFTTDHQSTKQENDITGFVLGIADPDESEASCELTVVREAAEIRVFSDGATAQLEPYYAHELFEQLCWAVTGARWA